MAAAAAEEPAWLEMEVGVAEEEVSGKRRRPPQEEVEAPASGPGTKRTKGTRSLSVSRFASRIPGHCIPVTGPRGHRVYAKLNLANPTHIPPPPQGLLSQSIHLLHARLENNALSKVAHLSISSINNLSISYCHSQLVLFWMHRLCSRVSNR